MASASFWGVFVTSPRSKACNVSSSASAPRAARRSWRVPALSSRTMGVFRCNRMGPASRSSTISIIVTPVTVSPGTSDQGMGAAPRYLGKREACTLRHPCGGISRIARGRIWPKATTTRTSGLIRRRWSTTSGFWIFTGWMTGRPASSATCLMAGFWSCFPRPAGRSGGCGDPANPGARLPFGTP